MPIGGNMSDLSVIRLAVTPLDFYDLGYNEIFLNINKVVVVSALMETPKNYIVVLSVEWKTNPEIKLLEDIEFFDEINELGSDGSNSIYLVRGRHLPFYSDVVLEIFENFNCFFEHPITYTKEYVYISIVGKRKDLERLIDYLKQIHPDFEIKYIKKYYLKEWGLLSVLTKRQYSTLKLAFMEGYYDIPKKADTRKLAKKIGIAHGTLSFHLRKAERTLLKTIFE